MSQNRCTIVTCYYKFPSKHSYENYDAWMTNFLSTVENEMIIFCDPESFSKVEALRKPFEDLTDIFVIPLEETYCGLPVYQEIWKKDWQRDTEKFIHNPNLYIIWNEKAMFMQRAIQVNPFETNFFMWCDIGCFRSKEDMHLFSTWPSQEFLNNAKKDKMYFLNIEPFKEGDLDILPNKLTKSFEGKNRIGGTIFFGHKDICVPWIEKYYYYMNVYMENNYFAGKDQNILATFYAAHPEMFELVQPQPNEGDPWFYLQRYFLKK
jgi:hypothetical protein